MTKDQPVILLDRQFSWRRVSTVIWLAILGSVAYWLIWELGPKFVHYVAVERLVPDRDGELPRVYIDLMVVVLGIVSAYLAFVCTKHFVRLLWFFVIGRRERQLVTSNEINVSLTFKRCKYRWSEIDRVDVFYVFFTGGYDVGVVLPTWFGIEGKYISVRTDVRLTESEVGDFLKMVRRYAKPRPRFVLTETFWKYL